MREGEGAADSARLSGLLPHVPTQQPGQRQSAHPRDTPHGHQPPHDAGAAPVLQRQEGATRHAQRHFRFGGGGADGGVEVAVEGVEAGEGHPEALAVLVIGQRAVQSVVHHAHCHRHVLGEGRAEGDAAAPVPRQPLVRQPPALAVLSQQVQEGVGVQAGPPGGHPEHHARAEQAAGHPDLKHKVALLKFSSLQRPTPGSETQSGPAEILFPPETYTRI